MSPSAIPGFIERFLDMAERYHDAVALEVDGGGPVMTYGDLLALMEQFRACFEKLELQPGATVMLLLPSGPDMIACIYALASLSAIAAPVNELLTPFEMQSIIEVMQPCGLVTSAALYHEHRPLFEKHAGLRFACFIDHSPPPSDKGPSLLPRASLDGRSSLHAPAGNPIATCHYTYKGLGYPLAVPHSYYNYSCCLAGIPQRYCQEPGTVNLLGLPLYTIYAIVWCILYPLSRGSRLVLVPDIFNQDLLSLLEAHRVQFTCLVPMLYPKLVREAVRRGGRAGLKLQPDLVLATGGSYLDAPSIEEIADATGIEMTQGYGLTETLPVIKNDPVPEHRGSLGFPVCPEVKIKIVDSRGTEAPLGRVGQIALGGPTLSPGFLNNPEANARFYRDGFFLTGDLGYQDSRGLLYFEGRALPVTKIASQMVDLVEVERVLCSHPAVHEARVIVQGRRDHNSFLSASVTVSDLQVTQKELKQYCKTILSRHKVPFKIALYKKSLCAIPS